ncbi:hypothetical protein SGLAM104S_00666 [Streptomyces glaucescens]
MPAVSGVEVAVAEVASDVAELGGGDVVDQIEDCPAHEVGVGGVVVGVDLEVDAAVLRLVRAGVLLPLAQGHLGAPGVRLNGVGAVSDRFGQPGVVVVEEGAGQRDVGVVAEGVGEGGPLLGEGDGEGALAGDLQPKERVGALLALLRVDLVVALDVAEEVRVALVVLQGGAVVPGVDEGLRRHFLAIAEGPAVLDGDGEVLLVGGLDLLGEHVLGRAGLRVVPLEPAEDHVEHLAALHLVGVGLLQRVLRVTPGGTQHLAARTTTAVATAPAGGRREGGRRRACDPLGVRGSAHGVPPLPQRTGARTRLLRCREMPRRYRQISTRTAHTAHALGPLGGSHPLAARPPKWIFEIRATDRRHPMPNR